MAVVARQAVHVLRLRVELDAAEKEVGSGQRVEADLVTRGQEVSRHADVDGFASPDEVGQAAFENRRRFEPGEAAVDRPLALALGHALDIGDPCTERSTQAVRIVDLGHTRRRGCVDPDGGQPLHVTDHEVAVDEARRGVVACFENR